MCICVGHHYMQPNTNKINKTRVLLQTTGGNTVLLQTTGGNTVLLQTTGGNSPTNNWR